MNWIENRIVEIRKSVPQFLKKLEKSPMFEKERNFIFDYTSFMNDCGFSYDFKTRVYFVLKHMRDFPKCQNPNCCNKVIHHRNVTNIDYEYAYPEFCSIDCRYHRDEQRKKIEEENEYRRKMDSRTDEECLRDLKGVLKLHPLYPQKYLKPTTFNNKLIEYVYKKTKILDNAKFEPSLSTRLYWAVNGLTEYPKCKCCGRPLDDKNVHSYSTGYPMFCSLKCENSANTELKKEYYETFTDDDFIKLLTKDDNELFDDLKMCLETDREYAKKILRPGEKWHYLYKFIMDSTDFLDDFYTMKTRVFYIIHGWKEERRCQECGKIIRKNMRSIYEKFPDFCSVKCSRPSSMKKSISTLQSKYGEDCKYSFNIPGMVERNTEIRRKNFEAKKKSEYEEYQKSLQPYQRDNANYWSLNKEQRELFVKELKELTFEHSEMYARTIMADGGKKHYLYKLIVQATTPLLSDPFYTFPTKVWFVLNGLKRFPRCLTCGERLDHRNLNMWSRGFPRFCSPRCGTIHEETQMKMQQSCLKSLGVKNSMQSEDVKKKSMKTMFNKYGVYFALQSEEIKKKCRQTSLRNYGVEYAIQSDEIKQKIKETNLKKYGYEYSSQSPIIRKKFIETLIKRYGVDNPQKSFEIKEKTKRTNIKRYGFENPMQNHKIFIKTLNRYSYDGMRFDSSWELAYYIWLKDNNIEFEYQPNICFNYTVHGKIHKYYPDFKCGNKVIEIKGNHFFDENGIMRCPYTKDVDRNEKYRIKQKCMEENDIELMKEIDIKPYLDYIENKYGKNYLKSFKEV